MAEKIIGIMGAMHEEINAIVHLLADREEYDHGKRSYYTGTINGTKVVLVFSRWGKVAAATTVSSLIIKFGVTDLLFIGVAGAISHQLKIGDIVIAERLVQHDMDARPLMERYEIPLLAITCLESDPMLLALAEQAIRSLMADDQFQHVVDKEDQETLLRSAPQLWKGMIASGDKFFSGLADKEDLQKNLPGVLCVEMEGAAVAQVCYEYGIPFVIIRIISDEASENSHIDFSSFITQVSSKYAAVIVKKLFSLIH